MFSAIPGRIAELTIEEVQNSKKIDFELFYLGIKENNGIELPQFEVLKTPTKP